MEKPPASQTRPRCSARHILAVSLTTGHPNTLTSDVIPMYMLVAVVLISMVDPVVDPHRDYAEEYGHLDGYGIGIVGAGAIVERAHLPAYEKAGFDVSGVTDVDRGRAESVADAFGVSVYDDLNDLLADDSVDVVDVAVPPQEQRDIVARIVPTGRHILCQKPLAAEMDSARDIVDLVADAGVVAAVNQQFRWEKSMRATHELIDQGTLGEVLCGRFDFGLESDWSNHQYMQESPRLDILYFGIHYLDAFRYLLGEPGRVYGSLARTPGQDARAETRSTTVLEYPDETRAVLDVDHHSWADQYATFRFEGTKGVVRGTVGLFMGLGDGETTRFEYRSRGDDDWQHQEIRNARFPDAFIGAMGSLLAAVETGTTPMTPPADNLGTLRLVNAVYRSANEKRAVTPAEVQTDHYPEF